MSTAEDRLIHLEAKVYELVMRLCEVEILTNRHKNDIALLNTNSSETSVPPTDAPIEAAFISAFDEWARGSEVWNGPLYDALLRARHAIRS